MADNPETPLWEPGIYQLETTDPVLGGLGGIDNRSNVELGNRTARIKQALDESGIYVIEGDHAYVGQNIDITATFEGSVSNGDAVYYNTGNSRYEKAIVPTKPTGIADVTGGRVISGGLILHPNVPSSIQGSTVYLSGSVAGTLTVTPTAVAIGVMLWKTGTNSGVISLNTGGALGQINHSDLNQDQTNQHFLETAIRHSVLDNDEPSIHTSLGDLIGHISMFVAANTPPPGYLECNGALISKTTYAALYTGNPFSIGNRFGESGGSFYLPDFRGRVPRGWANGTSRDPDRASRYADTGGITGDNPGSMQNDQYLSHSHPPQAGYGNFMSSTGSTHGRGGDTYGTFLNTGFRGGNETRMKNFGAMYIIRYQ